MRLWSHTARTVEQKTAIGIVNIRQLSTNLTMELDYKWLRNLEIPRSESYRVWVEGGILSIELVQRLIKGFELGELKIMHRRSAPTSVSIAVAIVQRISVTKRTKHRGKMYSKNNHFNPRDCWVLTELPYSASTTWIPQTINLSRGWIARCRLRCLVFYCSRVQISKLRTNFNGRTKKK